MFHRRTKIIATLGPATDTPGIPKRQLSGRAAACNVQAGDVVARATSSGDLVPRKGINVKYARPEMPAITDRNLEDLALAADAGADFVALSFVRSAAEEAPAIHGRARAGVRETLAASVMHAAVELAEEVDAAALLVPTSGGGSPRTRAKYRRRQPIISLPRSHDIANQPTLERGVYPWTIDVGGSVDDVIERSLLTAKEFAGLASGTRVMITAGRRTGTPGATNLIMVRDIP